MSLRPHGPAAPGTAADATLLRTASHRVAVLTAGLVLLVALLMTAAAGAVAVAGAGAAGLVIGRRAVRPLGRALALQRRFVADAGHELRTPLTVLHTRAQLIRRRLSPDVPPAQAQNLDRLVADAASLGEVIEDLLLSARMEEQPWHARPVDLVLLAARTTDQLGDLARERGITLIPRVPPGQEPVIVDGVVTALRRALTALVDNALAHTPPGGRVTIGVDLVPAPPARAPRGGPDLVELSVTDDGEGPGDTDPGLLLRRFARGTEHGDGRRFGLGLSLVTDVARAHGGSFTIAAGRGGGTVATLRLPRARAGSALPPPPPP